ncbi:MAG: CoA transferase [Acidimicrobiales bacterium]
MALDPTSSRPADAIEVWANSGAMSITGRAGGPPLGPPAPLVDRLTVVAEALRARSAELGNEVSIAPIELLGERAAIAGLTRNGSTSCGGATRLLPVADGWVAVSLARSDDIDLVPAWLGTVADPADPWAAVSEAVCDQSAAVVVDRACGLGLAVAALPVAPATVPARCSGPLPHHAHRIGPAPRAAVLGDLVVADLSSLWAGPLCGSLLADAGAEVWKIESTQRPDGARRGAAGFFDLLNAGKRSVAVDFTTSAGRRHLCALVEHADIVIESSRVRALEQLGLDARDLLEHGRPRAWISITAHGRMPPGRDRVGFGDDAAGAGGLVAWDGDEPCFCADAVADPTTGLVAAAACLDALAAGGSWLVDVAMASVAAHLAGPTLPAPAGLVAAPPVARPTRGVAPPLGSDTAPVLATLPAAP